MKRTRDRRGISEYRVVGSAALAPRRQTRAGIEVVPNHVKRKRDKAAFMNAPYVLFLGLSLVAMVACSGMFLKLQSDVTAKTKSLARLESEVAAMTMSNDEEYARIMGAVDLEKIKQVAMEDLGMTYPDESQVVNFEDSDSDYVRQFGSIPQ